MESIYGSIAARTGGNIYIGVVGPVRTGKSTFIKRVMEQMVIPNIEEPYRRERARDELPQSGSGKTIMTSEPKFIPEEAVEISPDGTTLLQVRMIDSVGYMVPGATGAVEDGIPRMVTTPWYDYEIPMTEAAEMGTKKVMQEHCTIGLVITTDGTITDIPREEYIAAEERAIDDMQSTGKPFLVIINSADPQGPAAQQVHKSLQERLGVDAVVADCQALTATEICNLLGKLLYQFPMQQLHIHLPRWMDALEDTHSVKMALYTALTDCFEKITTLNTAANQLQNLSNLEQVVAVNLTQTDLATGTVTCVLAFPDALFYEILSSRAGMPIENEGALLSLLTELSAIKKDYDKISDALASARTTGYGIVMPGEGDMTLQTPEVVRKGSTYGVKLKAGAPSIHMIRVDIDTEISPMVGGEQQSQDMIAYFSSEEPDKLWQSHIFGKSVNAMIQEGLTTKLLRTPEDVREKFRGSLTRIVNEGAQGLICLIL
ncbi:MAG: stage IV sporulation protein A [Oscillospiraceae bacterium]|nr:stage IV sporulation protein A [Oscillospiraceae bacterium]